MKELKMPGRRAAAVMAIGIAALTGSAAWAADSDTQTVNFEVQEINEIDIAGGAVTLTVSTATAGSQPTAANAASSYAITTNAGTDGKKITAALNTAMPANVTLQVSVAAPSGGSTSAGAVALTNSAVDVVTGIEAVAASAVAIDYTLSATVAAAPVSGTKTVTYTLVDST